MLGHLTSRGQAPRAPRAPSSVYPLIILWIGLYLIWGSLLTQQLWLHGWHATPEQWAYHALMEQLGISHHHGYEPDYPLSSPGTEAQAPSRGITGLDLVAAQALAPAAPVDGSSLLAAAVAALVVGALPIARLARHRRSPLTRFREPPEPPPPTALSC